MSCLKKAEDGENWILRLYNPQAETGCGEVTLPAAVAAVQEVRLDETGGAALSCQGRGFRVEVEPNKIKTYHITFRKEEQ